MGYCRWKWSFSCFNHTTWRSRRDIMYVARCTCFYCLQYVCMNRDCWQRRNMFLFFPKHWWSAVVSTRQLAKIHRICSFLASQTREITFHACSRRRERARAMNNFGKWSSSSGMHAMLVLKDAHKSSFLPYNLVFISQMWASLSYTEQALGRH